MQSSNNLPLRANRVRQAHNPGPSTRPTSETQNNSSASGLPLNSPSPPDKPYGRDLRGKVTLLCTPEKALPWLIGHGAFTDVYQGEYKAGNDATTTFVALKIFRISMHETQEKIEDVTRRLVRESKVWQKLHHTNIQPYLGYCSDVGLSVALVSPLCSNGSIMKYIFSNPSASRLQLVREVARGIEYLHSLDVIHADLHCKNILVDEEGHARLVDFGRARVIGEAGYRTAFMAGTAPYMAPELLPTNNDVDVDHLFSKQSDVYAFAMSSFEIFTGDGPFKCYNFPMDYQIVPLIQQGKKPKCTLRVQSLISRNMWKIMEDCWADKPEDRLSAEEIVRKMP